MTFLPVVERELRVAARLPGTHWVRLVAAFIALGIGGWIMAIPYFRNTPGVLGMALFVSMSILVNFYALIIGVLRTADCLSEEKREGTLGLLFLTDLKGYDIVLGKLAATSLNTFYGMLAIFPILAISLLVGGVTGTEFWRMVVVSVDNLLFSLALGMFCSAISRDERKAMTLALLLIIFFAGGLPLIGAIVKHWTNAPFLNPLFFIFSPGYCTFMAFDASFKSVANFNFFYPAVGAVHAVTWLLLFVACLIVPRTWQDEAISAGSLERASIWTNLVFGARPKRDARRLRLLDRNPIYWLTSRDRMKSVFLWLFLAAVGLLWICGLLAYPEEWKNTSAYLWTGFITHTVLKLWIAGEACRRFCLDRQSGAMELLLSTPLSVRQILQGQFMSLRRQFALPAALIILSDLIFLASEQDADWTLTWFAWISMLIADLITLSWVSMWMGLNSRNTARAAAASIVRVMFLPWMAFMALLTAAAISSIFLARIMPRGFDGKLLICIWMLFGFLNDLIFGLWAARKLQTEFRLVATRRFQTRAEMRIAASSPAPAPVLAQAQEL